MQTQINTDNNDLFIFYFFFCHSCSESQIKVEEGNSTSDVVCGSASRHRYVFISSVVLFLIIVICLVTNRICESKVSAI